jgi:hypothetical protein
MRRHLVASLAIVLMLIVSLIGAETLLRLALATSLIPGLRDPERYFSRREDGYWYLANRWGITRPRDPAHPLLGWVGDFDPQTYRHHDAATLRGRRPILLYGDSFSQCVRRTRRCYQQVLDEDERFTIHHRLLNYGVGGYGLDQIYLLMRASAPLYKDPVVVFGFYLDDIDRALLAVREGPKPQLAVNEGRLDVLGVPIDPDPKNGFRRHAPFIGSYLFRLWRQAGMPIGPYRFTWERQARDEEVRRERARRLTTSVLRAVERDHPDAIVLVFHDLVNIGKADTWRDDLLRVELRGRRAIFVKDLIAADMARRARAAVDYFIPVDRHPNDVQIELVADAIRREIVP